VIALTNLAKSFQGLPVLAGVDLEVPKGSFSVLIGPSGCGKSTLLDVITGVCPRDAGELSWEGRPRQDLRDAAAYMQQNDLLLPWRSLLDNALLPAEVAGRDLPAARRKAGELLVRMGLAGFEGHRPHMVSGGMRQRCALVRTLMFERPIILLDEPFASLDAITRRRLHRLLLLLPTDFGRTILMITHDIEEALMLADQLLVASPSPMRVRGRWRLAQPKPRRPEDPEILRIRGEVLALLEDAEGGA
jgi:NitT/TauT family transport system ATP-binding protein